MEKLLFLLDSDPLPSTFDTVVGFDGGADHVLSYGGVTPQNVGALVDGAIFTRGPKEKRFTALFIGGSNLADGQALFKAVQKKFFANFRVSVMLDSNGSNTTAAAGVAMLAQRGSLAGKRAVVLAGTGPVGQRAAVLLAKEGATVAITSRKQERAEAACRLMEERFGVALDPIEAVDNAARARALQGAQIAFAAGAAGVQLLSSKDWQDNSSLEMVLDCNAQPPLGVEGVDIMDKGADRSGKAAFGAIGFGGLKLQVHRACIGRLFESPDQVLDAEQIYAIAKSMV